LHNELKLLATEESGDGIPVRIQLGAKVDDIVSLESLPSVDSFSSCADSKLYQNPDTGTITLADSSTYTADLVIAADGVHSAAVTLVTGRENPAESTGQSAFRFLIPTEAILEDPETRSFIEGKEGRFKIFVGDAGRRLVWYPCREWVSLPWIRFEWKKWNLMRLSTAVKWSATEFCWHSSRQ